MDAFAKLAAYKHPLMVMVDDVAKSYFLTHEELLGRSRKAKIIAARHELFYRAKKRFSASEISLRLGFHHTTILWGASAYAQKHGLEPVTGMDARKKREMNRDRAKGIIWEPRAPTQKTPEPYSRTPKMPKTKLTEQEVREIRGSKQGIRFLALAYGVSMPTIDRIKKRQAWKRVA